MIFSTAWSRLRISVPLRPSVRLMCELFEKFILKPAEDSRQFLCQLSSSLIGHSTIIFIWLEKQKKIKCCFQLLHGETWVRLSTAYSKWIPFKIRHKSTKLIKRDVFCVWQLITSQKLHVLLCVCLLMNLTRPDASAQIMLVFKA